MDITLFASGSSFTPDYFELNPECSQLERGVLSQVKGRIFGHGLQPGGFTTLHPSYLQGVEPFSSDALKTGSGGINLIEMTNVLNKRVKRQLVRWVPQNASERDIRLFVMQAQRTTGNLVSPNSISIKNIDENCQETGVCWELQLQDKRYVLEFDLHGANLGEQSPVVRYFQLKQLKSLSD